MRYWAKLCVLLLAACTTGCGSFMAHRMVQAPNLYPTWLHPEPRLFLYLNTRLLTNYPVRFATVGSPPVKLCYRVVEPGDYHFTASATNLTHNGHDVLSLTFNTALRSQTNQWTSNPRGTVFLLHGYGLAQFAMVPWALRLAQDGWRCVLVDLRGHGRSNGKKVYFGAREVDDLKQLLDEIKVNGQICEPVSVMGESYGASLALRWKSEDPQVQRAIAVAPYGSLSNAVLNICHDYARWIPKTLIRSGLKNMPRLLDIHANELDTTTVLQRRPVSALFIAGESDVVAPPAEVRKLFQITSGSKLIVVPHANHEAVTYFFNELAPPIEEWLQNE